jgi:4,5-dihydroxyphthalate decarboxylase
MLNLSLACRGYELTTNLMNGRVKPEGIDLNYVMIDYPAETFKRMLTYNDFDCSEMSLANYLSTFELNRRYIAIPIFPARAFRHSYLFVNTDSGVNKPERLVGKKIGIFPGYFTTMAVWIRGILKDEFDVNPTEVTWISAKEERVEIQVPKGLNLRRAPQNESVFDMLVDGTIDALISPLVPISYLENSKVERLFPDFEFSESEYFRRTGIFPIMHTIVIRESVFEKNPWVAVSLSRAFEEAKKMYYKQRDNSIGDLHAFAWIRALYERERKLFGADAYPYGLEPNRKVLETFIRYSIDQGVISRRIEPSELFAKNTIDPYYMSY